MESEATWPAALVAGRVVSLPKAADGGPVVPPGGLRPITVLSMVTRLWGKVRNHSPQAWQRGWASPVQSGLRGHRGAEAGAWGNAFGVEGARLAQRVEVGVTFDLAKAFDSVPWDILEGLLMHTGCSELVRGS